MSGRGDQFFEDEFVLTNIMALMKTGALRVAFQERVLSDTTGQLDGRVRELVDWMVGKTQRQAGAVLDFMHAHTRAAAQEQLVGAGEYTRNPPLLVILGPSLTDCLWLQLGGRSSPAARSWWRRCSGTLRVWFQRTMAKHRCGLIAQSSPNPHLLFT